MITIHDISSVRTHQLTDLRNALDKRVGQLSELHVELLKGAVFLDGSLCSGDLADFIYELQGDLKTWARTLHRLAGYQLTNSL